MLQTRPAGPGDERFLYLLYKSTRQHELAAWGWDETASDVFCAMQHRLQTQAYTARYPDAEHLVLRLGEQQIGRLMTCRREEAILLVDLSLLPAYRGQGLGGDVLRALLQEAESSGRVLRLHVRRDNPAIRLYERVGLRIVEAGDVYHRMESHIPLYK